MDIFKVAFIGHRQIDDIRYIEDKLEDICYNLLCEKEYVEFYVGRNGEFDICVASAIKRVQKKRGNENSSLILVLPYQTCNDEYYMNFYDSVCYPLDKNTYYKAAITKRNRWLVDMCDMLISHVIRDAGGAYATCTYAKKLKKQIVNIE